MTDKIRSDIAKAIDQVFGSAAGSPSRDAVREAVFAVLSAHGIPHDPRGMVPAERIVAELQLTRRELDDVSGSDIVEVNAERLAVLVGLAWHALDDARPGE